MVQALVNLAEKQTRILNIVKAKYGLKNKSEAMNLILEQYGETMLEPELKPEFIERMKEIEKEKHYSFNNMEELDRIIDNEEI